MWSLCGRCLNLARHPLQSPLPSLSSPAALAGIPRTFRPSGSKELEVIAMLFNRRILVLPALVALSLQHSGAFTPVILGGNGRNPSCHRRHHHHRDASSPSSSSSRLPLSSSSLTSSETETDVVDLSIPYDAAARLAYAEWCAKFSKVPDEGRYVAFKSNYETITVANVVAAKEYIDAGGIVGGSDRPKDLELNEYGDMTEEEYVAIMGGGGGGDAPSSSAGAAADVIDNTDKGPLETFMEASEAQSEASIALAEAADALAVEEEVRSHEFFFFPLSLHSPHFFISFLPSLGCIYFFFHAPLPR